MGNKTVDIIVAPAPQSMPIMQGVAMARFGISRTCLLFESRLDALNREMPIARRWMYYLVVVSRLRVEGGDRKSSFAEVVGAISRLSFVPAHCTEEAPDLGRARCRSRQLPRWRHESAQRQRRQHCRDSGMPRMAIVPRMDVDM